MATAEGFCKDLKSISERNPYKILRTAPGSIQYAHIYVYMFFNLRGLDEVLK